MVGRGGYLYVRNDKNVQQARVKPPKPQLNVKKNDIPIMPNN